MAVGFSARFRPDSLPFLKICVASTPTRLPRISSGHCPSGACVLDSFVPANLPSGAQGKVRQGHSVLNGFRTLSIQPCVPQRGVFRASRGRMSPDTRSEPPPVVPTAASVPGVAENGAPPCPAWPSPRPAVTLSACSDVDTGHPAFLGAFFFRAPPSFTPRCPSFPAGCRPDWCAASAWS